MIRVVCAVLLLASSCAFDLEPCASNEDCPPGTTCERPARTGAPMCIAPEEIIIVTEPTPDTERPVNKDDTGVDPIPWDTNNGNPNGTSNNQLPLDCPVVASCGADEPNDSEDDAIYLTRFAQGCSGFRFEEWSSLYQDSVCDGDVDQFILEYEACDEGSFKVTVSLTTPDTCLGGGDLQIAESLYDCWDENVRCEVEDGVQRIIAIIPPSPQPNPVAQMRFAVRQGLAADGVDYILRATIDR